jgi:hypothetical protein
VPRDPFDPSHRAKQREGTAGTQSGSQVALGSAEEGSVEHCDGGHTAMHPAPDVLDCGGRLAVKEIEGTLGMEPNELGVRLAEPDGVVLMPRSVDENVPDSVCTLLSRAVGVLGGDDLHLMAGTGEALSEIARVVLHPSDAVLRNDERDNADPHRATSIQFRTSGVPRYAAEKGASGSIRRQDNSSRRELMRVKTGALCAG